MRAVRVALAVLAFCLLAATVELANRIDAWSTDPAATLVSLLASACLLFGGLLAWQRRRWGRTGALVFAGGLALNLGLFRVAFDGPAAWFTVGWLAYTTLSLVLVQLLLSFPSGRLGRLERQLVAVGGYVLPVLLGGVWMLVWDPTRAGWWNPGDVEQMPRNLLMVADLPAVAAALDTARTVAGCAVAVAVTVLLVRRLSAGARRDIAPVLWAGAAWALAYIPQEVVIRWGGSLTVSSQGGFTDLGTAVWFLLPQATVVALAGALLYAGLLHERVARSRVADLVLELDEAVPSVRLRDALARSLGDPTLAVAYPREANGGWVDADGRPTDPPVAGPGQAVTAVVRGGRQIAAIRHDAALRAQPTVLQAAAAAAALALENERLTALTLAQLEEVHASRARLVTAGDAARRRIERDLRDRVQRHLDELPRRLRQLVGAPTDHVRAAVSGAASNAQRAIDELRELAHGIFPAVLADEGLAAAVEVLVERSDTPIEIGSLVEGRLAPAVEAAAYFAIAESVRGTTGTPIVDVARNQELLIVRISDDGGQGSASFTEVADRVGAADGRLHVQPNGETGRVIQVEIPCG
jgi:signal transduction histidine kinase